MASMKLIVSVAILVLGAATLGSAEWSHQGGYTYHQYYTQQQQNHYQQQKYYQNQYIAQPGVSASEFEWVCKNPKTGDTMFIISEDVPAGNGQGQWQQQRPPTGRPVQPNYATYPQQPDYLKPQPSFHKTPVYPTQPPTVPTYPTTQPPNQDTPPNTGGVDAIDVRFGEKQ